VKFLYLIEVLGFIAYVTTFPSFVLSAKENKSPIYDSSKLNYCQAGRPSLKNYKSIDGFTLKSVQIVTRHGDRTPITVVKNNEDVTWQCNAPNEYVSVSEPNSDLTYLEFIDSETDPDFINPFIKKTLWKGSCFPGQLTQKGSEQHVQLGKALREIYVDKLKFIDEQSLSDLYVRSTNVLRTQLSVRSLLKGLMPNRTEAITIHTVPKEIETFQINSKACPILKDIEEKLKNEDPWKEYIQRNLLLTKTLDQYLGYSLNKNNEKNENYGYEYYVDTYLARACHNMELPCIEGNCDYNTEMITQINNNGDFEYEFLYSKGENSKKYLTAGIGYALKEIIRNMEKVIGGKPFSRNNSNVPTFYIYSAHDDSVGPIMGALGIEPMEWPPYASNLIFELWKKDDDKSHVDSYDFNDYMVRVIYNGKIIKTNWCDFNACPLLSLYDRFKEYFPSNNECFEPLNEK